MITIDWTIISTIVGPVIALFTGAALDRIIERKVKLIAYFTHASAFTLATSNVVHTHGIVLKNIGSKSARDIRVRHTFLPKNYNVHPDMERRVENLPGGGVEIVFPRLVPNEQVSISYLYFPPTTWNQIHAGILHNEGFAKEVMALPTPQYPAWVLQVLRFLLILGLIALLYLIVKGFYFFIKIFVLLNSN